MNEAHYKSWAGLKKRLEALLCPALSGRVTYFLTRYHAVHNAYGRAAVRLDGAELVVFSWIEMARQEADLYEQYRQDGSWDWEDPALREKWAREGRLCDMDFLRAAAAYPDLPVGEALTGPDPILRMLALLDRRVGRRTLERLARERAFAAEPPWLQRFYLLRFEADHVQMEI